MAALRPYVFYRDAAFWLGSASYGLNRWLVRPHVNSAFLRGHANDLWLIPCALPLVLWLHDQLGWREGGPPTAGEVVAHLVGWSVLLEWAGPVLRRASVGDPWDVACYTVGAIGAWAWWNRPVERAGPLMGFDRLAPHYRWMEGVAAGPLLQRCRTRFIGQLSTARHVLVLGPGRGLFVRALLEHNAEARLTLVDSSEQMLALVERDLARHGASSSRVDFVHGDIRDLSWPADTFDAVASHFFLDCFTPGELDAVVSQVARWTTDDARWVVSDFTVPADGWRRWRAKAIHAAMYAFFRLTTGISARRVTPPDGSLRRAGFVLRTRIGANQGLLHADLWSR